MKFQPGKVLKRDGFGNYISYAYQPQFKAFGLTRTTDAGPTRWYRSFQSAKRALKKATFESQQCHFVPPQKEEKA
jgi:hypothetical protein